MTKKDLCKIHILQIGSLSRCYFVGEGLDPPDGKSDLNGQIFRIWRFLHEFYPIEV